MIKKCTTLLDFVDSFVAFDDCVTDEIHSRVSSWMDIFCVLPKRLYVCTMVCNILCEILFRRPFVSTCIRLVNH
jgi:hypothetical protein